LTQAPLPRVPRTAWARDLPACHCRLPRPPSQHRPALRGNRSFPERASRPSVRRTDGFAAYLKERWTAGCQNATQLYAELQARGFTGSYHSVRRQLAAWRSALPGASEEPLPRTVPTVLKHPSARRVSWLLLLDEADLELQEQQFREQLQERCPELQRASQLAREFRKLVRLHEESGWDTWLSQARAPEAAKELRGFAEGLHKDEAAVRAALRLPWSNGQVEGQMNRLKMIKRQMYGRAKFDLLRQRVLLAS
jgi:transposase